MEKNFPDKLRQSECPLVYATPIPSFNNFLTGLQLHVLVDLLWIIDSDNCQMNVEPRTSGQVLENLVWAGVRVRTSTLFWSWFQNPVSCCLLSIQSSLVTTPRGHSGDLPLICFHSIYFWWFWLLWGAEHMTQVWPIRVSQFPGYRPNMTQSEWIKWNPSGLGAWKIYNLDLL